jgi:transcription elongation factor Elf1
MFKCSHCHKLNVIRSVERDAGDYIAVCSACATKNILAISMINRILVPIIETRGYRD